MDQIAAYIRSKQPKLQTLLWDLHRLILSYPDLRCSLRWQVPFYTRHRHICYLNPLKNGGVEVGFLNGAQMPSEGLETRGRKMVAGLTIRSTDEIDETLAAALEEAIRLDLPKS